MAMLRQQKIQDSQKHSSELFDCLTILCTQSIQTYITSLDCMLTIKCVRTCQIFQSFHTQGAYQFKIFDDCDFFKICKIHSNAYQSKMFDDCLSIKTFYDRDFCKICRFHSEEKKRQSIVCFLCASVMGDLMSPHVKIRQSRVSKYSFHKKFISGQQSQDSFPQFEFL